MRELPQEIPDASTLLALEPEELATKKAGVLSTTLTNQMAESGHYQITLYIRSISERISALHLQKRGHGWRHKAVSFR